MLAFALAGGSAVAAGYRRPVDLKLLILATTGEESGLAALRSFLDYEGTPYDVVKVANGQPLPPLNDDRKGFYQGVILTLGDLGVCRPDCRTGSKPPRIAAWSSSIPPTPVTPACGRRDDPPRRA